MADRREPPLLFDGVLTLTSLVADTSLWHTIIGIANAMGTDEKRLHRFVGPDVTVDLLIPDHLPAQVDVRLRGHAAVAIAGGRRALDRAGRVGVDLGGERGEVIVPDLLGALVLKSRAARTDHRDNERHINDIAFLSSLVADPLSMSDQLNAKERASLRSFSMPTDARRAPWVFLERDVRQDALDAWATLLKVRR